MGRRIVLLAIVLLVLGGAGFAVYSLLFISPERPVVEEPDAPVSVGKAIPTQADFDRLARGDAVGAFEACLLRYERDGIKGFTATLEKQERVEGDLHEREVVQIVCAGEVPAHPGEHPKTRIRMIWESGFRKDLLGTKLAATLYDAGANKNNMITYRPTSFLKEVSVDPKSSLTRSASRYCITDAGLYRGMLRTYDAWKKRQAAGRLHAQYLGIETPPQLGRACYVIRRTSTTPEVDPFALDEAPNPKANPQRDGATEITAYIDVERWLHIGTVLKRQDGSLLAEYFFRDVVLSTSEFKPDPFTMEALKAAVKK
jgi:hypothetical protein